jgi:hypothetical protein
MGMETTLIMETTKATSIAISRAGAEEVLVAISRVVMAITIEVVIAIAGVDMEVHSEASEEGDGIDRIFFRL